MDQGRSVKPAKTALTRQSTSTNAALPHSCKPTFISLRSKHLAKPAAIAGESAVCMCGRARHTILAKMAHWAGSRLTTARHGTCCKPVKRPFVRRTAIPPPADPCRANAVSCHAALRSYQHMRTGHQAPRSKERLGQSRSGSSGTRQMMPMGGTVASNYGKRAISLQQIYLVANKCSQRACIIRDFQCIFIRTA